MAEETKFRIRLLANTPETRERGLMFAKELADDEVALFTFPYANKYAFWNKNVDFDLTLAFLDENMKIVHFADLKAQQKESVAPDKEARFVVEAKKGIFDKLGFQKGDIVRYDTDNTLKIKKGS